MAEGANPSSKFDDPEQSRIFAQHMIEVACGFVRTTQDSSAAVGRWVIGSLLIMNGGAAVAVIGADIVLIYKKFAASVFCAGLMFANLSGFLLFLNLNRVAALYMGVVSYWVSVAATGIRMADREADNRLIYGRARNMLRPSLIGGLLSSCCFLLGIAITAIAEPPGSRSIAASAMSQPPARSTTSPVPTEQEATAASIKATGADGGT